MRGMNSSVALTWGKLGLPDGWWMPDKIVWQYWSSHSATLSKII